MSAHKNSHDPFAAGPDAGEAFASSLSDAARERFRQCESLEEIIRAADKPAEVMAYVMEGGRFASLDEANAFLSELQEKWNTTPRPELFEHSPLEVSDLLYRLPPKLDRILFDIDLSGQEEAILGSKLFRNWRAMLEYFADHEAGATAQGNLNRKAVEDLKGVLEMARALAERPEWIRNEQDWEELGTLRACAQFAGLLGRRKGKWRATRKGRALLAGGGVPMLYAFLFDAWFNRLDWSTMNRRGDLGRIRFQDFRYFILSALERTAPTWINFTAFLDRLLHDMLRLEFRRDAMHLSARDEAFELRFFFRYPLFDYLERMGIVAMRRREGADGDLDEICMTAFGRRFVRSLCAPVASVSK